MEIKEAIEFVREIKHSGNGYGNSYISDFNKLKDIISLLQQGEKYRLMWEETKLQNYVCYRVFNNRKAKKLSYQIGISELMKDIEEKYFPKGV